MMKKIIYLLICSTLCWGREKNLSTRYEKGFFSVDVLSGYTQSRALNSDSTFSKFTGLNYGVQFEISLVQSDSGDVRFVGSWIHEDLKEKDGVFKQHNDLMGMGLKFYASRSWYLQATYGDNSQKFESSSDSYSVKNKFFGTALGYDYALTESLMLGVGAQYTTNPIKKTNSISSNSFSESGQFFLILSWSPPMTIINTTITNSSY